MTTGRLIIDLQQDEGLRLHAYPDPISHGAPWTCGYGCTGPDVGPHTVWSQAQAQAQLNRRVAELETQLDRDLPWWRTLSDVRQDALANMAFNLGVGGISKFSRFLTALRLHDYTSAAAAMLNSAWADQVGDRARRLASQIRTGQAAGSAAPARTARAAAAPIEVDL